MSVCVQCRANFHKSCLDTSCDCSLASHQPVSDPSPTRDEESEDTNEEHSEDEDWRLSLRTGRSSGTQRGLKRDATLKDQQSTGRKRAARMYPLNRESPCEWRNQANCGGGKYPIVGCVTGLQEARHHGPDKSTSNNEEGNVHRICHRCHNRWHSANNKEYDWSNTVPIPHRPRPQTEEEAEQALFDEFMFKARGEKKVRD